MSAKVYVCPPKCPLGLSVRKPRPPLGLRSQHDSESFVDVVNDHHGVGHKVAEQDVNCLPRRNSAQFPGGNRPIESLCDIFHPLGDGANRDVIAEKSTEVVDERGQRAHHAGAGRGACG